MVDSDSDTTPSDRADVVADLDEQAADLCCIHDHITRVIANLDIDENWFTDYENPSRAKFDLGAVVRLFLYKQTRGFNQSELERRLKGAAYVYVRFGFQQPLSQQIISYCWRNRFSAAERQTIKAAAERIREICADHDIIRADEPALDPDDVTVEHGIGEGQIMDAVERATDLGFDEFSANRASNAKYALEAYFERQGYLNMAKAGTTTLRRRFARLSDRDEVPHGSTHNRTMKKVANPLPQTVLGEYEGGQRPLDWKRIRDAVLPKFHAGVEKQLDEIAGRDRQGIRQPVIAAIDIVTFNFWSSPFKDKTNVGPDEEPVQGDSRREVYPKEDYPKMVSGFKDSNKKKAERGYKFATCTIVAEDTPIVLAIEPVRDERWWEKADESVDVERTPRAEIVERLLEQAEQHVDIHKVFCDRGFDGHGIRDVIDRRTIQYVNGKRKNAEEDFENIEEIIEDPMYDMRIEYAKGWYEGRMHKVSIIYLPGGEYSVFTVSGWIDGDRAQALTEQYRQRWTIENEYKTIKKHFLPTTATKDYRIRFLYFVIGVIMHNVWRLANFVLRDEVAVDLGEDPPLRAGEIVELVGFCLFDPGD